MHNWEFSIKDNDLQYRKQGTADLKMITLLEK